MRKSVPFKEVEFTNRLGHVIKPGSRCIVMTTCTGISNLYPATYLGLRNGNAVVDIDDSRRIFVNDKDEPYDWEGEHKEFPYIYFNSPYRYGTPEWVAGHAVWKETVVKPREENRLKRHTGYSYKDFPFTRRSILQNNNVFPADLALKDFSL